MAGWRIVEIQAQLQTPVTLLAVQIRFFKKPVWIRRLETLVSYAVGGPCSHARMTEMTSNFSLLSQLYRVACGR